MKLYTETHLYEFVTHLYECLLMLLFMHKQMSEFWHFSKKPAIFNRGFP